VSSDGSTLFSGSKDLTIKVWDRNYNCVEILTAHGGQIEDLVCIPGYLFSAAFDRTIRVWADHYSTGKTESAPHIIGKF
jgi:WD40 repeat protein